MLGGEKEAVPCDPTCRSDDLEDTGLELLYDRDDAVPRVEGLAIATYSPRTRAAFGHVLSSITAAPTLWLRRLFVVHFRSLWPQQTKPGGLCNPPGFLHFSGGRYWT